MTKMKIVINFGFLRLKFHIKLFRETIIPKGRKGERQEGRKEEGKTSGILSKLLE